jgi:hypothetical protein
MFDFVLLPTVAVLPVSNHLPHELANNYYPGAYPDVPLPPPPSK